jgi:carbonic anhydrase
VLGHARCGGIRAFAERGEPLSPGDFIGKWMSLIAPAAAAIGTRNDAPGSYFTRLEHAALAVALDNLMTFPCVRILSERGRLALHAAYFDVASGELAARNPVTGQFGSVTGESLPVR